MHRGSAGRQDAGQNGRDARAPRQATSWGGRFPWERAVPAGTVRRADGQRCVGRSRFRLHRGSAGRQDAGQNGRDARAPRPGYVMEGGRFSWERAAPAGPAREDAMGRSRFRLRRGREPGLSPREQPERALRPGLPQALPLPSESVWRQVWPWPLGPRWRPESLPLPLGLLPAPRFRQVTLNRNRWRPNKSPRVSFS